MAVKVFPSIIPALVMTKACIFLRSPACRTRVRRERKRSAWPERGCVMATRCGSTRAAEMSRVTNSGVRAEPAAPKVAPAAREADPAGSADPPGVTVCSLDADLCAVTGDVRLRPAPFVREARARGPKLRAARGVEDARGVCTLLARLSSALRVGKEVERVGDLLDDVAPDRFNARSEACEQRVVAEVV